MPTIVKTEAHLFMGAIIIVKTHGSFFIFWHFWFHQQPYDLIMEISKIAPNLTMSFFSVTCNTILILMPTKCCSCAHAQQLVRTGVHSRAISYFSLAFICWWWNGLWPTPGVAVGRGESSPSGRSYFFMIIIFLCQVRSKCWSIQQDWEGKVDVLQGGQIV